VFVTDSHKTNVVPPKFSEAARDGIRARLDANGLLERLDLNPRVLRLGSDELAGRIVQAVRTAQEDWLAKGNRPGADASPIPEGLDQKTLMRRLEEMEAQADRGYARLTATLEETLRRMDGA
jgi:hypothetical protein